MDIQNKLLLEIVQHHKNATENSKIGCDGYWFDNWQDHAAYVIKHMLTKSEREVLTDDERKLV
jgi:hypothetical protein